MRKRFRDDVGRVAVAGSQRRKASLLPIFLPSAQRPAVKSDAKWMWLKSSSIERTAMRNAGWSLPIPVLC